MINEPAIETKDTINVMQFLQRKTIIVDEMNLNGLAENWLKYLKINRNRSDNTIRSYATDIATSLLHISNGKR